MATFDQMMAESGRQSELDRIRATPGGYEKALVQYNAGQFGQTSSQPSRQNYGQTGNQSWQQMFQQIQSALQPGKQAAISTLQAQQPGISAVSQEQLTTAQAQKPTVEQRYKDTLAEITQGTRRAATAEFTRRGIPLSSALVEQTVESRLAPQIQQAATQRDVNMLGVDQLIANIRSGQQGQSLDLAKAIAAIQGGGSQDAVNSALSLYGSQQSGQQQGFANQLAQQQLELEKQKTAYDINKPYYAPDSGGGDSFFNNPIIQKALAKQFGLDLGDTPSTGTPPAFSPSKGEGSIWEQPDGSIWKFTSGNWRQM